MSQFVYSYSYVIWHVRRSFYSMSYLPCWSATSHCVICLSRCCCKMLPSDEYGKFRVCSISLISLLCFVNVLLGYPLIQLFRYTEQSFPFNKMTLIAFRTVCHFTCLFLFNCKVDAGDSVQCDGQQRMSDMHELLSSLVLR